MVRCSVMEKYMSPGPPFCSNMPFISPGIGRKNLQGAQYFETVPKGNGLLNYYTQAGLSFHANRNPVYASVINRVH
jgi:hypothetical protein